MKEKTKQKIIRMCEMNRMTDTEKVIYSTWERIYDLTVGEISDFHIKKTDFDDFGTIMNSVQVLFYHSINHILLEKEITDVNNLLQVIDDCVELFWGRFEKFTDEHDLILEKDNEFFTKRMSEMEMN